MHKNILIDTITILLLFCLNTVAAENQKPNKLEEWVDIKSDSVFQDDIITYSGYIAKGLVSAPTTTIIEVADGNVAVILSQVSPSMFERKKSWKNQYRVVYLTKENERVIGKIAGESIAIPSGHWVSSLTYLPPKTLLKAEISEIIIQGFAIPERVKILNDAKDEQLKREREIKALVKKVSFPKPVIGKPYNFEIKLNDGTIFNSKQIRGRLLLVDFWNTHCSPCLKALPELKSLYQKYGKDALEIISISTDNTKEEINELVNDKNLLWPHAVIEGELLAQAALKKLGFIGVPGYLFIDKSGNLIKTQQGAKPEPSLMNDIEELLSK